MMRYNPFATAIYVVIIGVFVALSACATLRTSTGSINVVGILSDAQYGLDAGCYTGWVAADDCTLGSDIIAAGQAISAQNKSGAEQAIKQSIVDAESRLSPTSRLRPYLDAIDALLA